MTQQRISPGIPAAHKLPADFSAALKKDGEAIPLWNDITPLARNEFICWIVNAKANETRERRLKRAIEELHEGRRRPCCWMGCVHRPDKAPNKTQRWIANGKK